MLALKVINFAIQLSVLRRVPVESHWYRSINLNYVESGITSHLRHRAPSASSSGTIKPRVVNHREASKKRLLRDAYGCATPLRDSVRDRPKALLSYAI